MTPNDLLMLVIKSKNKEINFLKLKIEYLTNLITKEQFDEICNERRMTLSEIKPINFLEDIKMLLFICNTSISIEEIGEIFCVKPFVVEEAITQLKENGVIETD